jgi:hypothetical protein
MFTHQDSQLFATLATGILIYNKSLCPQISWDTKIADFVPEWRLMDPIASAESTIVDVMSHRTGLPRHDLIFFPADTVPDSVGVANDPCELWIIDSPFPISQTFHWVPRALAVQPHVHASFLLPTSASRNSIRTICKRFHH